jgi:hypothetical protein
LMVYAVIGGMSPLPNLFVSLSVKINAKIEKKKVIDQHAATSDGRARTDGCPSAAVRGNRVGRRPVWNRSRLTCAAVRLMSWADEMENGRQAKSTE